MRAQHVRERGDQAGLAQPGHQNEQARHQREHAPRHVLQQGPRCLAPGRLHRCDGHQRGQQRGRAQREPERRGGQHREHHGHDADGREPPGARKRRHVRRGVDGARELGAEQERQRAPGRDHRGHRRQREGAHPGRQRGHVLAEHDQVGRIRDGQHEARRVGDEGAREQVGQGLRAGLLGHHVDRGRQHHGRRVVGHERGHHHADAVDQREQAPRRTLGVPHGPAGQRVEQALASREFRQQHHAGQEQGDVPALEHGLQRAGDRQQPAGQQRERPGPGPDGFGPLVRPDDDRGGGGSDDDPGGDVGRAGDGPMDHVRAMGWRRDEAARRASIVPAENGGFLPPNSIMSPEAGRTSMQASCISPEDRPERP